MTLALFAATLWTTVSQVVKIEVLDSDEETPAAKEEAAESDAGGSQLAPTVRDSSSCDEMPTPADAVESTGPEAGAPPTADDVEPGLFTGRDTQDAEDHEEATPPAAARWSPHSLLPYCQKNGAAPHARKRKHDDSLSPQMTQALKRRAAEKQVATAASASASASAAVSPPVTRSKRSVQDKLQKLHL